MALPPDSYAPRVSQTSPAALKPASAHFGLARRLAVLGLVLFSEKVLLDGLVDSHDAQSAQGFAAWLHDAQHWGFRFLVTFLASLAVFAYVRSGREQKSSVAGSRSGPAMAVWVLVHALSLAILVPVIHTLYGSGPLSFGTTAALAIMLGAVAAVAGLLAAAPGRFWVESARALGMAWLYAALIGAAGVIAWQWSEKLWEPAAFLTFDLVRHMLAPLLPSLRVDAATRVLATDRFAVQVSETCSGLEGMGLIFAFSTAWLIYFRREYFFPRALLLIPAGLLIIYGLNAVRISALMLIGYAGYPDVAISGFHTQAGWIAFNVTAGGLVFLSRRSAWLNRTAGASRVLTRTENPTAAYLMPLLAILATGMLSHALSGSFETLYPLRLLVGGIVIWTYRKRLLATLDWRCSWRGPAVGILVFMVWVSAAHYLLTPLPMPTQLHRMAWPAQVVWIASRSAASVVTVPIAEELAYRGFLMRRIANKDFESVPFPAIRAPAIVLSSVVFGLGHGVLWQAGIVAGVAFALVLNRRGRIGEAVAAHATANALLVVAVLEWNQWQLW